MVSLGGFPVSGHLAATHFATHVSVIRRVRVGPGSRDVTGCLRQRRRTATAPLSSGRPPHLLPYQPPLSRLELLRKIPGRIAGTTYRTLNATCLLAARQTSSRRIAHGRCLSIADSLRLGGHQVPSYLATYSWLLCPEPKTADRCASRRRLSQPERESTMGKNTQVNLGQIRGRPSLLGITLSQTKR